MASNDKSKDAGKSEKAAKPAEKKIGDKSPNARFACGRGDGCR